MAEIRRRGVQNRGLERFPPQTGDHWSYDLTWNGWCSECGRYHEMHQRTGVVHVTVQRDGAVTMEVRCKNNRLCEPAPDIDR
jgi:hypothetical protein